MTTTAPEDEQYETIVVELDYPIATLKLNRPEKLNALSAQLAREVIDALDRLEADDEVRAVVLCGDPEQGSVMQWKRHLESIWPFSRRVWNFRKPIIAAVHGYCLGGGCEIAMLCDMTIASSDCRLGEPEIRFSTGSTLIMPWIVPMKIARELLYTGKTIDAQRAYEVGMVNEVVEPEDLMQRAYYHARLIAKVSPLAVELTKEGINRTYEIMGLLNALNHHDNLVAILDGSETDELRQFEEIRAARGLRAALDWRDQQFREVDDRA
jgi:enoyl-CoA hydratase/carnithine racemase